ncbi:MAG TPA: ATP-binding cassette domain-containing protein [Gemmatimonadaceae bacterium]
MSAPTVASTALSIRDLQVNRGDRAVLRSVSVDIAQGEVVALLGASGAGKSTVLRAVAALQSFDGGSISVRGAELRPGAVPPESKLRELRRAVGVVFQAPSLFEHLTAVQNITLAPIRVLGWEDARARSAAMTLLDSLGVAHRADALPRQLSGGEAQRVAIARALALDPALLLMDEPTSALDPARRQALGESVRALAKSGRALLIATHDMDFANGYADRAILLADGVVVADNRRLPGSSA